MANELTDIDRDVLRHLTEGPQTPTELADAVEHDEETVTVRLDWLADNGLVAPESAETERNAPTSEDDAVALTDSGRRVLAAPNDAQADEQIDTPDSVERVVAVYDLRPDRADAVRKAFAFVRHRGSVTTDELTECVFPEAHADYETPEEWWEDCVEPVLTTVAEHGLLSTDGATWRYEAEASDEWELPADDGAAVAEDADTEVDGRRMLSAGDDDPAGSDATDDRQSNR